MKPTRLFAPPWPGGQIERGRDRRRVRRVDEPDPDDDKEEVLHLVRPPRALPRRELGFPGRSAGGLTEPVTFSSPASVDHLLWALAGVPHTAQEAGSPYSRPDSVRPRTYFNPAARGNTPRSRFRRNVRKVCSGRVGCGGVRGEGARSGRSRARDVGCPEYDLGRSARLRGPRASGSAQRHQRSPGVRARRSPIGGIGVERSLPADSKNSRNSSVRITQTVWLPCPSSGPVEQQPFR